MDPTLLDRLIRGEQCLPAAMGDPDRAFVAVVLLDLDRTHDLVVTLARDAYLRYERGGPGFRPHSPHLKREAARVMGRSVSACREMAAAWADSMLIGEAPEWIATALADAK